MKLAALIPCAGLALALLSVAAQAQNRTVTINLTNQELTVVARALGKQPYEEVAPVIGRISEQVQEQSQPPARETAPSTTARPEGHPQAQAQPEAPPPAPPAAQQGQTPTQTPAK